jgi:hypothetical protein
MAAPASYLAAWLFQERGTLLRQVNSYHNKSTTRQVYQVTLTVTHEGAALKHKNQETGRRHPSKSGIRKERHKQLHQEGKTHE